MRYTKGFFAELPDDYGKGHLPSVRLDASHLKQFIWRNASVAGLTLSIFSIATMVI